MITATKTCQACGDEFTSMADLQAHGPVCPHAQDFVEFALLFDMFADYADDVDGEPFAHEDFWGRAS